MNKPLTFDELKTLPCGEPVWLIPQGPIPYAEKYYYKNDNEDIDNAHGVALYDEHDEDDVIIKESDYGTKWVAYKNKEQAKGCDERTGKEVAQEILQTLYDEAIQYGKTTVGIEHMAQKYGVEVKYRLAELEDKLQSGRLVELSNENLIKLLRCIVFKAKYNRGNNYFEPFKGADGFGQPQVMSMDELLLRTVISLLGIESKSQAEARLKELRGEK